MGLGAGAGGPSFALLIRVDFSQAASLARSSSCACVVAEGLFAASDEKAKILDGPTVELQVEETGKLFH